MVLTGAEPVLFVERGGKGLQVLVDADDPRIEPSLAALADAVQRGRIKRLALEKIDGEPVVGSAYEERAARPRLPRRPAQAHAHHLIAANRRAASRRARG